jgi:carbonic anhydrase
MCSDSLLSPETILDTSSRNLFVIRSAGTLILPILMHSASDIWFCAHVWQYSGNVIDTRAIGTLEHALEIYPIKVLVLIGHDGCSTLHYACSVGVCSHLFISPTSLYHLTREFS